MKIELLCSRPEYVNDVARMIHTEFVVKKGGEMTFAEVVAYFSNAGDKRFPITFIALEGERCIGTVSLFENDWKERKQYTSWLASLYTGSAHRGKGAAQRLMDQARNKARELGYRELYLRTEEASAYYRARGWDPVETVIGEKGRTVAIFRRDLE